MDLQIFGNKTKVSQSRNIQGKYSKNNGPQYLVVKRGFRVLLRRQTIALACMLLVACFVLGADHYRSTAVLKTGKEVVIADNRKTDPINWQDTPKILINKKIGKLIDLDGAANGFTAPPAGGDTCGSATIIGSLPYNDDGTTVGMMDNYDLPTAFVAPTITGCPTCNAAGGGPAEAAPRGGVYLGTGTAPDVAYSLTFSSSNNGIDVTLTPTGTEDLALIVYTGVCSNLLSDAIVVDDDGAGGEAEHVVISNMPAGTYNIVVDGYSTGGTPPGPSGPYTVAITGTGTIIGGPTPTPTDTPTATPTASPTGTPAISGTVTYGNAAVPPKFISNVTVTGTGSPIVTTTTAAPGGTAGQYSLGGFGAGSYIVTLAKTAGQNGITSNDAARIAQHVAGTSLLNTTQKVVADVSNNGVVSSFDAAEIANYVVSATPAGIAGTWRFFVPPGPTFPVSSSPTSRTYPSVTTTISGEDYIGLLIGEVTGNWAPSALRPANGPERSTAVAAPRLVTPADNEVIIPIAIQGAANKGIISYEFDLRYDPSVIQPQANPVDLAGTVSRGLTAVANAVEPGLLRVVMYGPMPIDGNGVLLNLRFQAVGAHGSVSPLTWERIMFNEGDPGTTTTDGEIKLSAAVESLIVK